MKKNNIVSILILCLNIAGLGCLIYFAIPYLTHNTQVANPDAMLPMERWDLAGMTLTLGMIPLFIVNLLEFLPAKRKGKRIAFLFLLPCVICAALVAHYWISSLF